MNNTGPNWGLIFGIFSLVCSTVTGGVVFGELKGKVKQNSESIAELKSDARDNANKLTDIRLDVKDIKAKLDFLVPTTAPRETGR